MELDRRLFLQNTTLVLGAAALAACGSDGKDSGTTPTAGSTGTPTNSEWEALADSLESVRIFTASDPGEWAGKEASHVPTAVVSGAAAVVGTTHGMDPDHWIDVVYARNQDGIVIGLVELSGTDAAGEATFDLPEGTTEITPFAHCNQHGLWQGDPVAV